ncbi:winged helix DNA-binding domain-containing protein [Aldersonia sp. NBC_00410]|uniref:winged helix-turn-helix domain-containing protein n=1 Tax=Aldersonia sp. NBC_00410 TaxID=2975954 RepID=UPI00225B29E0|nr:crosslink repair DNA glycosylase YcaQ family protein [Aldersonia sp. NBC_00410]MCX5046586.1 winged helix DNA-binding domain-containing protein [Aldersonia sp. NBC_00410]
MREMSIAAARRTALAAQGFAAPRATGPANRARVLKVLDRTQLLQIDSVSAVVRAQYAPVFSRIGAYDRALLDEAAWRDSARKPRKLVEYWAHEAALIPVDDWPLMRWRMRRYEHGRWAGMRRVVERNPTLGRDILDVITEAGPCTAGDVERHLEIERPKRNGSWWNLSDTKVICEQLFAAGELTVPTRVGFTRHYDRADRVLPADVWSRAVAEPDAIRELVAKASTALGVATEADLRDYYRLARDQTAPAIADLVEAGALEPVSVRGWTQPAYLAAGARTPRRITAAALLCPFDPVVFFRARTERLFDFHFRIEIYTPEAKRIHGYYVFPFLLDGELVARVDLRADRAGSRLIVPGAFAEPGRGSEVAPALAGALREMADWLELDDVVVGERGDLAAELARAVTVRV